MSYEQERIRQIQHEIDWLREKLKSAKREKHRKDLERQIKDREYNLHLADFNYRGSSINRETQ